MDQFLGSGLPTVQNTHQIAQVVNPAGASCAAASGSPGFFDGLDLVRARIVHLPDWHPDEPVSRPLDISGLL